MGAYYALPTFQQRYGRFVGGKWVIESQWQTAITMAGYLGQIFGALGVAAWPLDRFGPRRTLCCRVWRHRLHLHPVLLAVYRGVVRQRATTGLTQ